jgi:hypothetical protein
MKHGREIRGGITVTVASAILGVVGIQQNWFDVQRPYSEEDGLQFPVHNFQPENLPGYEAVFGNDKNKPVVYTAASQPEKVEVENTPAPTASSAPPHPHASKAPPHTSKPFIVLAAGDFCEPDPKGCIVTSNIAARQRASAEGLDAVLAAGDLAYPEGSPSQFKRYDKYWGPFKSITYPSYGNHETRSKGKGYYGYWHNRGLSIPYYKAQLGSWTLYSLNSEIRGDASSPQGKWFKSQIDQQPPDTCSIIEFHRPYYADAGRDYQKNTKYLYKLALEGGVDIAITGHDHAYARTPPMNERNQVDPHGIVNWIVGTGGAVKFNAHHPLGHPWEKAIPYTWGMLKMELGPTGYNTQFLDGKDKVLDQYSSDCQNK